MIDRRTVRKGAGAAALGALVLTAVATGTGLAASGTSGQEPLGDPAATAQAESS
ncbi:hypothetical protein [Streptomyces yangpuensis]